MGIAEEYGNIISLLEQIKKNICLGNLRLKDLEEDLITELLEAGFAPGSMSEQKVQSQQLIEEYCKKYKNIKDENQEQQFLEEIILEMKRWEQVLEKRERELVRTMQKVQQGVLPQHLCNLNEEDIEYIEVNINELFMQHNSAVSEVDFQRIDVVVKYFAIENYFGKNDYGFSMYQKLQQVRQATALANVPEGIDYGEISKISFLELIKSVEKNGFMQEEMISCDDRLYLLDGAHRLALCLYFKIPRIKIRMLKKSVNIIPYTLDYMRENHFTEEELKLVGEKTRKLMEEHKIRFFCTLMPVLDVFFEQITEEIRTGCTVLSCRDNYISGKITRRLELEILSPRFRWDDMKKQCISTTAERLADMIDHKYRKLVRCSSEEPLIIIKSGNSEI